jgi:hypothetical protein
VHGHHVRARARVRRQVVERRVHHQVHILEQRRVERGDAVGAAAPQRPEAPVHHVHVDERDTGSGEHRQVLVEPLRAPRVHTDAQRRTAR